MSAIEKLKLKRAKAVVKDFLSPFVSSPVPTTKFAGGVRVETNANAVARFPLPLTIGSAVMIAIGALAIVKGHRKTGFAICALGAVGVGAAAAAPEINGALK